MKPIVYWVDSATPEKWRPYVRRGVEKWQSAFEAAGFSNAILAKDAPTPEQDPEWSAEDARYSVIRWLPSTIENASGPHVHDPRTGEILETDIQFYHNVMNLTRSWYFLQSGPLDPRAKTLPLPDDLMGSLIEYVVAHEVGHTLGFPHNMKASSMYPVEKLRDKQWLKEMGHTPTLMDYSRFNYVAQPEDGIEPAAFIPGIGPYDKWATKWGYAPIPGAKTPDDEKKTLDTWAREQDATPWLRFSTHESNGADPGELTEAVGDADAVMATTMGLKNLEAGGGHADARDDRVVADRRAVRRSRGVVRPHAGAVGHRALSRRGHRRRLQLAAEARRPERRAIHAVGARASGGRGEVPERECVRDAGLRDSAGDPAAHRTGRRARSRARGAAARAQRAAQPGATRTARRAVRARRQERLQADRVPRRSASWHLARVVGVGFRRRTITIDAYRRNLQRAYVDTLRDRIRARDTAPGDARALFKGELRALDREIRAALARKPERMTALHLEDVRDQIARALDPKMEGTGAAAPAPATGQRPSDAAEAFNDEVVDDASGVMDPFAADRGCWYDYGIRRDELTKPAMRPAPYTAVATFRLALLA